MLSGPVAPFTPPTSFSELPTNLEHVWDGARKHTVCSSNNSSRLNFVRDIDLALGKGINILFRVEVKNLVNNNNI